MNRSLCIAALVLLTACSEKPAEPAEVGAQKSSVSEGYRLPVSINDVMVALVNEAADPIWVAAWHQPSTDAEWRELERRAYQLELAGSLIAYPGTGGLDEKWTAKPPWRQWSNQLRDSGADAIAAIKAKDSAQISKVGDQIVEICEGCHRDFKLAFPTGGKFGELSPTADDLEK
jgi:hypothetical protein